MTYEKKDTPQEIGHEPSEPNVTKVALLLVGLLAATALVLIVVAGVFAILTSLRSDNVSTVGASAPEVLPQLVPELDPYQADELQRLQARAQHLLSQYQWIDQKAGVARIPIDRAIDILAKQTPLPKSQQGSPETTHEE